MKPVTHEPEQKICSVAMFDTTDSVLSFQAKKGGKKVFLSSPLWTAIVLSLRNAELRKVSLGSVTLLLRKFGRLNIATDYGSVTRGD